MPRKVSSPRAPDRTLAIIGLLLNIFILPGVGTLVVGKIREGVWQLVLCIVGFFIILISIPLMLVLVGFGLIFVGIGMCIASWIWALVTSIQSLQTT